METKKIRMSLERLKKETYEASRKYYKIGGIYLYRNDSREYVFIEQDGLLAHFQSFDGCNLFVPVDSLGTFLPDVASEGMELVKVD